MTEDITLHNREKISTLTTECVTHLHNLLSKNYHLIDGMDAVEPPGIKNIDMLESAVYRQHTGSSGWYKYDTVFKNCATLVFAITKNHAFHNGNKRVAFLAMIKHLFENGYVLSPSTRHDHIYQLLIALADDKIPSFFWQTDKKLFRQNKPKGEWKDEDVINILAQWLRQNSQYKNGVVKVNIRTNHFKEMLEKKGIFLETNGTWVTLYQVKKKTILGIPIDKIERYNEKKYGIGSSISDIGIKVINQIRKDYLLTERDGFDNNAFYDGDEFIDQELITYKKIIYKLSKT